VFDSARPDLNLNTWRMIPKTEIVPAPAFCAAAPQRLLFVNRRDRGMLPERARVAVGGMP
jgi:hypothetical protein